MMPNENSKDLNYDVFLLPAADKELQKLPVTIQKQIMPFLLSLKNPIQITAIKMQNKENTFRVRTGDYRVLYKIYSSEKMVIVIKISHRKKAYRKSEL